MDIYHNIISSIELDNIEEIAKSNINRLNLEHRFKVYSNIKEKSLINWCYILLKENELKKFINNKIIRADSTFYKRLVKLDKVGDLFILLQNVYYNMMK